MRVRELHDAVDCWNQLQKKEDHRKHEEEDRDHSWVWEVPSVFLSDKVEDHIDEDWVNVEDKVLSQIPEQ